MTTPADDRPSIDDVLEPGTGTPTRDRSEHGGAGRPDDDRLADLAQQERVDAGLADYDPDRVPSATDAAADVDITQTEQYQQELTEARRVARESDRG